MLAILISAFTTVLLAQQPAQPPAGTGVIAGILTTDRGEPVRKATVRVVSASPRLNRTVTSDGEGRFMISELPAGEYTLSALRPGFLEMIYGARQPGNTRPGTPIRLAAGQKIENIKLQLPRGGVIAGIVLDEFGDPAFNVPVRAMRLGYQNGERVVVTGGTGTTDDQGAYRLAGLLPGEYLVTAVPRDTVATLAATAEAVTVRQAQIQAAARGGSAEARSAAITIDEARREGRMPEPPPSRGYVPVYYPDTPLAATAVRVRVGLSQQLFGIDMRLQIVETATIDGTLLDVDGKPIAGNVQLVDPALPIASVGVWFRTARPDGRFSFAGVLPGAYVLRGHNSPPGTIGGQPESGGPFQMSVATPISVSSAGVRDVRLGMAPNGSISGKLSLETFDAPVDLSRVVINFPPVTTSADWEAALVRTPPDPGGTFTLKEVVPGRYRVDVSGLPVGWTLASATFEGRDAADHHLILQAGQDYRGGVLSFTNKTAEIAGGLTNALNAPVTGHTVVLFPSDRQLWLPQSRRIRVAQTGPDGRFTFRDLMAGPYRLAAVTDLESGQQFDRDFLAQLFAASIELTLGEGERKMQDIKSR